MTGDQRGSDAVQLSDAVTSVPASDAIVQGLKTPNRGIPMNEQSKGQSLRGPQAVTRELDVNAIAGRVVPFASIKRCPACIVPRAAMAMRYHDDDTKDAPYLLVTCGVCGFHWMEEPAWTL